MCVGYLSHMCMCSVVVVFDWLCAFTAVSSRQAVSLTYSDADVQNTGTCEFKSKVAVLSPWYKAHKLYRSVGATSQF